MKSFIFSARVRVRAHARRRVRLFLVTGLALVGLQACPSTPTRVDGVFRADLPETGPEPGDLESVGRQYLFDMAVLLEDLERPPDEIVEAVDRYLDTNGEAIEENARLIAERIEEMSAPERRYYAERFTEFFESATRRWQEVLRAFREVHPESARRIDRILRNFQ